VLAADLGSLGVLELVPGAAGKTGHATVVYGAYQTCHGVVTYPDCALVTPGTYDWPAGDRWTWNWTVPATAPANGTVVVTCGESTYAIPFDACGAAPAPRMTPTAVPWPTPLGCDLGRNDCG
jgi:hypothetical protein